MCVTRIKLLQLRHIVFNNARQYQWHKPCYFLYPPVTQQFVFFCFQQLPEQQQVTCPRTPPTQPSPRQPSPRGECSPACPPTLLSSLPSRRPACSSYLLPHRASWIYSTGYWTLPRRRNVLNEHLGVSHLSLKNTLQNINIISISLTDLQSPQYQFRICKVFLICLQVLCLSSLVLLYCRC